VPATRTTEGDSLLAALAAELSSGGEQGWLVGGSVRDRALGRDSPDIDVVVTGDAAAVSRRVARSMAAPWFTLSEEYRAYRVVGRAAHLDIAAVRGGDILTDLAQRDFTVNAMAIPVGGEEGRGAGPLIDPFNGLNDLQHRRLAAVSDRVFRDDPLRLMRAARFGHVLDLDLDLRLREAVQRQAGEIFQAAPERIAAEMVLTLSAGRAGDAARLWSKLGLLEAVMPELKGDAEADFLFRRLDRLEDVLADLPGRFADAAPLLQRRLSEPADGATERPVALRLAGLMQGLAPAQAVAVGRRLRLSTALVSLVEIAARIIGRRDRPLFTEDPADGPRAAYDDAGRDRPGSAAILFLWGAQPWEAEIVLLAAADATARGDQQASQEAGRLMSIWAEREQGGVPRLPFDGVALMQELDLPPGPRLGTALRAARLAWEAGDAKTYAQAVAVGRQALSKG
jgi:poly(A) polymerase